MYKDKGYGLIGNVYYDIEQIFEKDKPMSEGELEA